MYLSGCLLLSQSCTYVCMYVCMCVFIFGINAPSLSVCLCLSVCLSVSVSLSVSSLSLSLSVCLSVSVSLYVSLSFSRHHANLRVIVCVRLSFWTMKNYFLFTFMSSNIGMIFTAGDALRLELCKRDLTEELDRLRRELQETGSQIPHLTEERDKARNERDRLARKSVCLSVCLSLPSSLPLSPSLLCLLPPPPPLNYWYSCLTH